MILTDDSRSIIAEIAYDARWDGVDEATAMEWEWEAQREIDAEWDVFYAMQAAAEGTILDGPIDDVPF